MRATFESLVGEYRAGEAGSAAMMAALMNQCLISSKKILLYSRRSG